MHLKDLNNKLRLIILIVMTMLIHGVAGATVEWEIFKTLEMDAIPIDMALTPDGKKLFVLTDKGNILIYSTGVAPTDKIEVGNHVDQIKIGPKGDLLVLSSRKTQRVELLRINFIQNINVSGSPFKGSEDAAVVIAVFDDFQ
jgi:DNA-binding beta-propeller fold protein YncE